MRLTTSSCASAVLFCLFLFLASVTSPAAEKRDNWVSVQTPNFTIISNTNEKKARQVATEFERMRAVFRAAFPNIPAEGAPILVLAVKSEKDSVQLLPPDRLGKGMLKIAGLFLRGPEKSYVLLRTDVSGENPYATIYHEYTHYLMRNAAGWIPLWLNEGLAEFYENTQIRSKDVLLGRPNTTALMLLRTNRILPLDVLLRVDHDSPYYRQEDKGSIFYAQSWALMHYLKIKDMQESTNRVLEYTKLVAQNSDPVAAATSAFGDLKKLQTELERYVDQAIFQAMQMPGSTEVDETQFRFQPITAAQADAFRADFMAYSRRSADAQTLAMQVLKEEPENVQAYETLGFLSFLDRKMDDAQKWYAKAVALNTQSYLAHYYFAVTTLDSNNSAAESQAENSLRTAIKLNPSFASAYNELAVYFGKRRRNLEEARKLSVQAVQLEPGKLNFRLNSASVLMQMGRAEDAVRVIRAAMRVANTPEEKDAAQKFLDQAEQYASALERSSQANRGTEGQRGFATGEPGASSEGGLVQVPEAEPSAPKLQRHAPDNAAGPTSSGPRGASASTGPAGADMSGVRRSATGRITEVQCAPPAKLDLKLDSAEGSMELHSENFYRLPFTAVNFIPDKELLPCTDLEGATARIEYIQPVGEKGQMVSVELRK
ncbi:MAG: DUF1570 domain-containing protein [Candidatus Korobacteraceae bacterium]